jgi:hypothetical protein
MNKFPIVSEDTVNSTFKSIIDVIKDGLTAATINQIRNENPILTDFVDSYCSVLATVDRASSVYFVMGVLSTYLLLKRQFEADVLNQELI